MCKHSSTPQKGSVVIFKALGFLWRVKKSLSIDKDIVVPSSDVISKVFDITQWYENIGHTEYYHLDISTQFFDINCSLK